MWWMEVELIYCSIFLEIAKCFIWHKKKFRTVMISNSTSGHLIHPSHSDWTWKSRAVELFQRKPVCLKWVMCDIVSVLWSGTYVPRMRGNFLSIISLIDCLTNNCLAFIYGCIDEYYWDRRVVGFKWGINFCSMSYFSGILQQGVNYLVDVQARLVLSEGSDMLWVDSSTKW